VTQIEALRRVPEGFSGSHDVLESAEGWPSAEVEALQREIARLRALREEAVAAQLRMTFLCEASKELASSLDAEATLDTVGRLAVPVVGDVCVVFLKSERGERLEVGAVHAHPPQARLVRDLVGHYLAAPASDEHPIDAAIRTGTTQIITRPTDSYLRRLTRSAAQLSQLRELALSSFLIVPLKAGGGVLGAMVLALTRTTASYDTDDVTLAEELAHRAAAAIKNALLHRAERRAREEAEAERSRLEAVLRRMPAGVAIVEAATGRVLLANEEMERIFGVPGVSIERPEDYRWYKGFRAEGRRLEPHDWPVARAMATGEVVDGEEIMIERDDGSRGVIRTSAAPIRDRDGRITAGVVTFYEISGQKAAERALRESEERYRLVEQASNAYLFAYNPATNETTYSDAIERVFKWDRASVPVAQAASMQWWLDRVHPADRPRISESFEAALTSGEEAWSKEYRFLRGDGRYAWVLDRAHIGRNERGEVTQIVGSVMDISDRMRVLEAQRHLAALVEASDEGIMSATCAGVIESWNRGAQRIFGYSAGEIVGRSVLVLIPPDRAAEARELLERGARGGDIIGFETVRRTKAGKDIEVSLSLSPIRDAAGDIVGLSAFIQDITERKELRERLALTERIAALGTLAAGVAHEINNPIAYVIANLEHIASDLDKLRAEERSGAISGALTSLNQFALDAKDGATRVAQIARGLKTLSRGDDDTRRPADLRAAVDMAVKMSAAAAQGRARIVKEYGDVPEVEANEARLVQVFINLVVNAAQAIPEGAAEDHEIRVVTRTDAAGRALVEVRDTGTGIAPEILDRVFEPFFTTKPVGVGTGIGLSICRGIVASHGGEITVESELGKGSVFRVALPPLSARRGAEEKDTPSSTAAALRRGRVLLIDDEVKLGQAIALELSAEHDPELVTSGAEALERFRRGDRFDVILCDLLMPSMSGMVLYEEIRRIDAAQAERMIFITGGAFTPAARRFLGDVKNRCLEKPFEMDVLRAIVRESLE
jgi:PAS domain S-box-containing protein